MNQRREEQKQEYFKTELHVHPFFESYGLEHVINIATEKNLDILVLERLNREIFPELLERSKKLPSYYKAEGDHASIQVFDKKYGKKLYLPKAIELNTKQNFHLIVIGDSKVKSDLNIEEAIEKALRDDCLVILDHPFADSSNVRKGVSKEKEAYVEKICKRYSGNVYLEWNAYCIPWVRKLIGGGDVNKKVVMLSEKLAEQGYNVPVITDSDIHARYKWSLKEIGKASMLIKKQAGSENSGKAIISNLKESINNGKYKTSKMHVSFTHLLFNFALPFFLPNLYKRPRG